jgi:hypothetical protein
MVVMPAQARNPGLESAQQTTQSLDAGFHRHDGRYLQLTQARHTQT